MRHRSIRRPVPTIVAVALLVAACGTAASSAPTGSSGLPAETAVVTPAPTPVGATATSRPSQPAAQPPSASLSAEGGDPVAGQLGSYTWLDGGSDSPWLPGAPIGVGAREPLTVTIGDGAVADWSARRVVAGTTDGTGALALGGGGPPVAFTAPGPGTWSVQVTIRFGGELGTATYYWQLAVQ